MLIFELERSFEGLFDEVIVNLCSSFNRSIRRRRGEEDFLIQKTSLDTKMRKEKDVD